MKPLRCRASTGQRKFTNCEEVEGEGVCVCVCGWEGARLGSDDHIRSRTPPWLQNSEGLMFRFNLQRLEIQLG